MEPTPVPDEAKAQRPWGKIMTFGPPVDNSSIRGLEDCGDLEVMVEVPVEDRDLPVCRSYWMPSPEDLIKLNAGQPVQLVVWGGQVPVDVSVEW